MGETEEALLTMAEVSLRKYREGDRRDAAARHVMSTGLRLLALHTSPAYAMQAARNVVIPTDFARPKPRLVR